MQSAKETTKDSKIVKQSAALIDIIKSKPLPDWIRNHQVFSELGTLQKVFPSIGLANFKKPIDFSEEGVDAMTSAKNLLADITKNLNEKAEEVYNAYYYNSSGTRDKSLIEYSRFLNQLATMVADHRCIQNENGKLSLRLIGSLELPSHKLSLTEGQSIFKVYTKIIELNKKFNNEELQPLDQISSFKTFSACNIGGKLFNICFSSTGEDGVWDIATISMRGIKSCQTWDTAQSRGLIGTISNKYTAVIYISSPSNIPGFGSKMVRRSVVRFVINKQTNKPAIIIDKIYPSTDTNVVNLFKTAIKERTKLPVYSCTEVKLADYFVPTDRSLKYLKAGEFSYMDNPIESKEVKKIKETANYRTEIDYFNNAILGKLNDIFDKGLSDHKIWKSQCKKLEKEAGNKKVKLPRLKSPIKNASINVVKFLRKQPNGYNSIVSHIRNTFEQLSVVHSSMDGFEAQEYKKKYKLEFCRKYNLVIQTSWKANPPNACSEKFPLAYKKMFFFIGDTMRNEYMNDVKKIIISQKQKLLEKQTFLSKKQH